MLEDYSFIDIKMSHYLPESQIPDTIECFEVNEVVVDDMEVLKIYLNQHDHIKICSVVLFDGLNPIHVYDQLLSRI